MVVEADRAVEVGEGDPERIGDRAQRLVREVLVAIVEGVEQGEERRGLVLPTVAEVLVGRGHTESLVNPERLDSVSKGFVSALVP